jgi:trigger factor
MLGLTSDVKVKVLSEKGCVHTLSVELANAKVKEKIEEAFKNVQSQAKLPGFRPGKAPIDMVKEAYQGSAYERAQDLLLREGVAEALKAKKMTPIQSPSILNLQFDPNKAFQFEFEVEVAPVVKPTGYKGLKLTRKTSVVSDADVERAISELAEMNARLVESKAEKVAAHHHVVIDYEGLLDGKTIPGAKADNFLLDLSAPQTISGLAEGLVGAGVNEQREIKVTFPADSPAKELAGKEAVFNVTVKAIKEKSVPVVDDEFAKDIGVETMAKLKDQVRQNLEGEKKRVVQTDLERQVVDLLLEANPFDAPPSLLARQVEELQQRQTNRLLQQGIGQADIVKFLEQNKAEIQKQAEKDVRLAYILNAIAAEESVEATDEETAKKMSDILARSDEKNRAKLEKMLKEKYIDQVRSEIREAKLFAWLIEQAKVKES